MAQDDSSSFSVAQEGKKDTLAVECIIETLTDMLLKRIPTAYLLHDTPFH